MKVTSCPLCARWRAMWTYWPGIFWWMNKNFIGSASPGLVAGRPQIERSALAQCDLEKSRLAEELVQAARSKSGAMRHEPVADRQRSGVSKNHVERRDRAALGDVGAVLEP